MYSRVSAHGALCPVKVNVSKPLVRRVRARCVAKALATVHNRTRVKFVLPLHVEYGESVCLVGDDEKLGRWNPEGCKPMYWDAVDGSAVWQTEAVFEAGRHLEYKYIIRLPDGTVKGWQPGQNQEVDVPAVPRADFTVKDEWSGPMDIKADKAEDFEPALSVAPPTAQPRSKPAAQPEPAVAQTTAVQSGAARGKTLVAVMSVAQPVNLQQKAKVKFFLPLHVEYGECVCLVGEQEELGAWRPEGCKALDWNMVDGQEVWQTEAELSTGAHVEYKYIIKLPGGSVKEWQEGDNQAFDVPATAEATIAVEDDWRGQVHLVSADKLLPSEDGVDTGAEGRLLVEPLETEST